MPEAQTDNDMMQKEILSRVSHDIRAHLGSHLRRIVLFGSRARGDARADSDYDLLVVVDEVTRKVENVIDDIAGEMLCQFGAVISAFPTSESVTQSRKYSPFLINVSKEGVLV